jgi:flagellin
MQTVKQSHDAASSQSEKDSYESEFQDLREQLSSLKNQSFNGNQLFNRGSDLSVSTSTDGSSGAVTLGDLDLADGFLFDDPITAGNPVVDLADMSLDITLDDTDLDPLKRHISVTNLIDIHSKISGTLAEAGGDESTLGFASDYLSSTATNLESALGRIEDVDLAEETANYAALTLRYEAAAAAIAQANASADTVFNLLMGSLGKD